MLFCPNCGTKNDDGARFCENCGTKLEGIQSVSAFPDAGVLQDTDRDVTGENTPTDEPARQMPWETGENQPDGQMPWETAENQSNGKTPWEMAENQPDGQMPWEAAENQSNGKKPWETGENQPDGKMPWETGGNQPNGKMPWEEQASQAGYEGNGQPEGMQQSWQQNGNGPDQQRSGQEEPMRPSQMKRARQQEQSGSTITFTKPSVDVGKYRDNIKRLTKTQIAVIVEAVCMVLIIGIFYALGSSQNSADAVAKRYFEAFCERDWSEVYDLTDYPDGVFLQKDQFIELMGQMQEMDITSFEIQGDAETFSGIQRSFLVQYTVKGQGTDSMQLDLMKQGEKSMLFFDTWKVSSDTQVVQDFCLNVPSGAQAAVDKIALEEGDKGESQLEGMDSYYVTLFRGSHTLQVALPWFTIYETEFNAAQGEQFTVSDMVLTEEGKTAIEAKMQEALEKIYQAAIAEKDFSEVSDLFLEDSQEIGKESYEYLVTALHDREDYVLNQVTFRDFKCEIYEDSSYQGMIRAEMNYSYDMKYTYSYKSWRDDSVRKEERDDDGNSYMSASFGYDGETYKLSEIGIQSVL